MKNIAHRYFCYLSIQHGFSLLEVVVALFIVAVGLISVAAMQLIALRHTQAAYFQSVATLQIASMLERLRANPKNKRSQELAVWNQINRKLLPNGKGNYHCVDEVYSICTVNLSWNEGTQKMTIRIRNHP